MSRLLFVGGPLHGACHPVPDGVSVYAALDPADRADLSLSAFWDEPCPMMAAPIHYQRIGWPYRVQEEAPASDIDHR